LDCKDKVVKFYHFKRKVKEAQKQSINKSNKLKSPPKEKKSKVVHNIVKIVEDYTAKCSITTVRIDESNKKLIIESQDTATLCSPHTGVSPQKTVFLEVPVVKSETEPDLLVENEDFRTDEDSIEDLTKNNADNNLCEDFHHCFGVSSEPSTSTSLTVKRSRSMVHRKETVHGELKFN
jgi:hypothetical protein